MPTRFYRSAFSSAGIGFAVAIVLSHLGYDLLAPAAMAIAAFGVMPLLPRGLFRLVAPRLSSWPGPVALYGTLARRLAVSAGIVLHLISASISAAGVGLLAMLPIGSQLSGPRYRASFSPA